MTETKEKVLCCTPTPGKQGVRIDKWKYDTVRRAILKNVPRKGQGAAFSTLHKSVKNCLSPEQVKRLGSVNWYTTVVKLDMEVKGEIYRVPGVNPQHLLRR